MADRGKGDPDKGVTIIVNGKNETWEEAEISYEQVVALAGETGKPSVTYTDAPAIGNQESSGSLTSIDPPIKVQKGMEFTVGETEKT